MTASRTRDITVSLDRGVRLAARMWGRGETPLLLIHGFMGSVESWGDLPARLGAHLTVLAVDLPGHGRSTGPTDPTRYAVTRVARDLADVQARVFGGPAWWMGYSMGGRIALSGAVEGHPVRGLLLESSSPGLEHASDREARRAQDEARARRLEAGGTRAFVEEWLGLPLFQGLQGCGPDVRERAASIRAGQDSGRMAAWLRGGGTGAQPSYWDRLTGVEVPVALLTGATDAKFQRVARDMLAQLPQAGWTSVPGVGHLVHVEAPEAWLAWVNRVTGGAGPMAGGAGPAVTGEGRAEGGAGPGDPGR